MPKFKYRMQNILDIKIKLETQARNEFAQAQIKLNEELDRKQTLIDRKKHYEDEARTLRDDVLNLKDINANMNAQLTIKMLIEKQETFVKRAQKEVDRKRAALNEIMQERKMHEKLREKALEEYLEQEKLSEGKIVDELTSYTYGRRNQN